MYIDNMFWGTNKV